MSESMTLAGGMIVAPDGTISYNFDGHIHAVGIDLDASDQRDFASFDRRVRWLLTDGTTVGSLWGWHDDSNGDVGAALVSAGLAGYDNIAQLKSTFADGSQGMRVEAITFADGSCQARLIGNHGEDLILAHFDGTVAGAFHPASSFVQLRGTPDMFELEWDGSTLNLYLGGDYVASFTPA